MNKRSKKRVIIDPPPISDGGLATLYHRLKNDKEIAKKIFGMVTEERGTDEELRAMVTRRSLLELIFLMIDLTKSSRAVTNQAKSKEKARLAKLIAQKKLYDWLDKNISKFPNALEECSEVATIEIKSLGRSESWVRQQITQYRKDRGLA
jgi:hypothetical protein